MKGFNRISPSLYVIVPLLLLNLGGCWILNDKTGSNGSGKFYTRPRKGGRQRLPLIKPHQAYRFPDSKSKDWKINFNPDSLTESSKGFMGVLNDADKIAIDTVNEVFFVGVDHQHYIPPAGGDFPKGWYVYNPEEGLVKGFTKKEAYQAYVDSLGYNPPPLKDIDSLWKRFDNGERLYWFPKPESKEAS